MRPTNDLRFARRLEQFADDTVRIIKVLQQKWESADGKTEWRDIPLVDEVDI